MLNAAILHHSMRGVNMFYCFVLNIDILICCGRMCVIFVDQTTPAASNAEDEFTNMGKLKCIGILRKKGIDYKCVNSFYNSQTVTFWV